MSTLIIVAGGVLLLAILFILFRIQILISILKGSYKQPAGISNKVNAGLFLFFLLAGFGLVFWYSPIAAESFLPEAASEHGVDIDTLFWVTMAVIGFVFIFTNVLLFWFSYKYQYKEERKALFYPHNDKLEIVWTVIPAIVLTVLVFFGWKVWTDITETPPKGALAVEIKGKQFGWEVRYPGSDGEIGSYDFRKIDGVNTFGMDFTDSANYDDFIAQNIVLPVGKPVTFKIRAVDVLHSVFAPHFRVKQDAVPGMPTQFTFTPTITTAEMKTQTGNPDFEYELACTEVCGRGHFSMKKTIVVVHPEEYDSWLADQKSFLSKNPEYVANLPENLKKVAVKNSGIKNQF